MGMRAIKKVWIGYMLHISALGIAFGHITIPFIFIINIACIHRAKVKTQAQMKSQRTAADQVTKDCINRGDRIQIPNIQKKSTRQNSLFALLTMYQKKTTNQKGYFSAK